jgi:hypothetical protein
MMRGKKTSNASAKKPVKKMMRGGKVKMMRGGEVKMMRGGKVKA